MGSSQEMSDDELFGPPVPTPPAIDLNQKKLVLAGTSKPVDVVVNKDLQIEVRASSVPRFLQCPSNIRLPRQVKVSTKQAKLGTAFHTICDCIVRGEDFSEQKVADEHGVDVVEVRKLTWAALKMWEQQGPSFPAAKTEVNLGSLILRHEGQSLDAAPGDVGAEQEGPGDPQALGQRVRTEEDPPDTDEMEE